MKKLQLIIIISTVLLASYAFPADFVMGDDVDSICMDSYRSRYGELSTARHGSPDGFLLISSFLGRPTFSTDVGIADIQSDNAETDIDLPEESKINDHGLTPMSSPLEDASVLTERRSAAALFRFPLEAYRLRI
jgi:hypothetical protein